MMTTRNGTPRRRTTAAQASPERRRVRLVGALVQLELVTDDGNTLEPLPTDPLTVPAGQWPPDLPAMLARLEDQLNAATPAEEPE